jgi:hypothetical protein
MGNRARRTYEDLYSPHRNYRQLVDIYQASIDTSLAEQVA